MNWLSQIKESPHYEHLKGSVDCRYARKQFILMSVFVGVIMIPLVLLFVLGCGNPTQAPVAVAMDFFLMLLVLGFWLHMGYCWLEIFLHMDSYIFFQAKLDQPHLETYRYSSRVRFTVEFTDRQGKQRKRDTGAIFSSNTDPFLEEYNNKEVLLAYNEETDRLIVICTV